jgi:adenine-specific DNA methylase
MQIGNRLTVNAKKTKENENLIEDLKKIVSETLNLPVIEDSKTSFKVIFDEEKKLEVGISLFPNFKEQELEKVIFAGDCAEHVCHAYLILNQRIAMYKQ